MHKRVSHGRVVSDDEGAEAPHPARRLTTTSLRWSPFRRPGPDRPLRP